MNKIKFVTVSNLKEFEGLHIQENEMQRPLNANHVREIAESMANGEVIEPVMLDDNSKKITSGQHRTEAAKLNWKKGLPAVLSIQIYKDNTDYTQKTIKAGQQTKKHSNGDIVYAYLHNGSESHKMLKEFADKYHYGLRSAAQLISKKTVKDYLNFDFKVTEDEIKRATELADWIEEFKKNFTKEEFGKGNDAICNAIGRLFRNESKTCKNFETRYNALTDKKTFWQAYETIHSHTAFNMAVHWETALTKALNKAETYKVNNKENKVVA